MDMTPPPGPATTLDSVVDLRDALSLAQRRIDLLARNEQLCRAGSFELQWPDTVLWQSAGLRALLGDDRGDCAEAVALEALDWIPPREKRLVARLWRGATVGEPFEFVHNVCCSDGRSLQVLHRGVLEPGREPGAAPRGVATLHDFTARRVAEQQIETLAHVDPVTGQSNRAHLLHQLGQAVHDSRLKDAGFTLLSVDIARVAELATTIGLAAGDELARVMAQRLLDAGLHDGVLAHLGSGEFAFRLGEAAGRGRDALDLAVQGLRTRLEQPVPMGNIEILPRCRIGAACFPQDATDAKGLLAAAQAARLDAATKGGRRCSRLPPARVRCASCSSRPACARPCRPRRWTWSTSRRSRWPAARSSASKPCCVGSPMPGGWSLPTNWWPWLNVPT